jgi:NADPH-ferrihemoprotein reductase
MGRTVLEVLADFPSCRMPLEHFLELVAPMTPRYYSISSSPKEHPQQVHVTAVIVQYTSPTGRVHDGVCTSWLSSLHATHDLVPAFIRKSTFKLPRDPSIPIVMIGPGTGVAPFRGFIQDRKHWRMCLQPLWLQSR